MVIKKSKSVRELVYEELKRLIIEGEIQPEERIVETEYAEKFQISRTPIREALRMLELEGFVESKSKGGVMVKSIKKSDIDEIYRIRIALEGVILEEVINNAKKKDIRRLERLMEDTEDLIDESGEDKEVFKLFSEFNDTLYDIASLDRVTEMITNINLYLRRFRRMAIESGDRKEVAFNDHRAIVEAIKEKAVEEARSLNKVHLERSRDFIKANIQY
ncbi:GntR family transcriptional regulator [Propionigenium maris DSM 9537]|uniref:GntR family transcriptional regulator n=1 Tax=Propionigenium maris DSM 9537 TaxID=1123000 RepID=A0A9W6GN08_9FUSO|nr:GntR family transcriptional regulator [Propionigenium maris]GLI57508.1 GntR family transcriptional regulator [Propionigenium maris DSM 9537]